MYSPEIRATASVCASFMLNPDVEFQYDKKRSSDEENSSEDNKADDDSSETYDEKLMIMQRSMDFSARRYGVL